MKNLHSSITDRQASLNFGPAVYRVSIVFGESPDTLQEFEFEHEESYWAFLAGIDAMNGWGEYHHVDDVLCDEDSLQYFTEMNPPATYEEARTRLVQHKDRQRLPKSPTKDVRHSFRVKKDGSGKLTKLPL